METFIQKKNHYLLGAIGVIVAFLIFNIGKSIMHDINHPDVTPYLDKAKQQSETAITHPITEIEAFFHDAKKQTGDFAHSAVGLKSKFKILTGKENHQRYIQSLFEEKVFSPQDLQDAIEHAITLYTDRLDKIENDMLTQMQNDLPDLPPGSLFRTLNHEQLFVAYQHTLANIQVISHRRTRDEIAVDVTSLAVGEILSSLAIMLAADAGILTTGAISGWATFGIGIGVGIVVDIIFSKITDIKGKVERQTDQQLDEMCSQLTDKLRQALLQYSETRSKQRTKAVNELLNQK